MHLFYKRFRLTATITLIFCTSFAAKLYAEEKGHEACNHCHIDLSPHREAANTALLFSPLELCLSCHNDRNSNRDHALGLEPGPDGMNIDLPLVDGLISCTTCHDSHAKTAGLLRLPSETFCLACHTL